MEAQSEFVRRRGVPTLLKDLKDETVNLIHYEVALAKLEMVEKAKIAGRNSVYVGIGGAILYTGILFILVSIGFLIYQGLVAVGATPGVAGWASPLIVGVIGGIIGAAFLAKGIQTLKNEPLVPEKTFETLKEDQKWLRQKTS